MTLNWGVYKDTIIKLYKTENMTLHQVREIMIQEHKFTAGIRTYRMYLKKWKVRKYRKHAEDPPASSWGRPQMPQMPTPPPSSRSAEAPDFGSQFMPAPQLVLPRPAFSHVIELTSERILRPWGDNLDVFPPGAWADRSPSVSASDYSACSMYDASVMESPLRMPAKSDSGHSTGAERRLEPDFTFLGLPGQTSGQDHRAFGNPWNGRP